MLQFVAALNFSTMSSSTYIKPVPSSIGVSLNTSFADKVGTFVDVIIIRKKIDGLKGVLISNLLGVIVMTLVMIPMNMWMGSEFMGINVQGFISGFLAVCVAFNLVKSTVNLTLYSLISPIICKEFNKLFNK